MGFRMPVMREDTREPDAEEKSRGADQTGDGADGAERARAGFHNRRVALGDAVRGKIRAVTCNNLRVDGSDRREAYTPAFKSSSFSSTATALSTASTALPYSRRSNPRSQALYRWRKPHAHSCGV
jgi:hypothetical protein